jgi:hypothetical protein
VIPEWRPVRRHSLNVSDHGRDRLVPAAIPGHTVDRRASCRLSPMDRIPRPARRHQRERPACGQPGGTTRPPGRARRSLRHLPHASRRLRRSPVQGLTVERRAGSSRWSPLTSADPQLVTGDRLAFTIRSPLTTTDGEIRPPELRDLVRVLVMVAVHRRGHVGDPRSGHRRPRRACGRGRSRADDGGSGRPGAHRASAPRRRRAQARALDRERTRGGTLTP